MPFIGHYFFYPNYEIMIKNLFTYFPFAEIMSSYPYNHYTALLGEKWTYLSMAQT